MDILKKTNEAVEYRKKGDFKGAESIYLEILKEHPNNSTILVSLGLIYYEQGKFKHAEEYLLKSYNIDKNRISIRFLGLMYARLEEFDNAKRFLKECAEFEVTPEIYNKLIAIIKMSEEGYFEGYKYASRLYEKYPMDFENILNLSECCLNIGKFSQGITLCDKAFNINPKHPKVWIIKGIIEEVIKFDDDKAKKYFRKAMKLGDKSEAYYNLCLNYSHSNRKIANRYGVYLLKNKLTVRTSGLKFFVGTNYFAMRKMKEGYKYYLSVWGDLPFAKEKVWDGKQHKDKTFYIFSVQGFGDLIMYIRYITFLAKKFKKVIVPCREEIYKLFKYSYSYLKNVEFIPETQKNIDYDYVTANIYLPHFLKKDYYNIPFSSGYLACDEKDVAEYKKRYFDTDNLKVGLCWEAGTASLRVLTNRTIPLKFFESIFNLDNVNLYSVQKNSTDIETDLFKKSNIIDLGSKSNNFYETALMLKNMDLLVTVDTSVAHLAGALGIKTIMLLPKYSEWRWFDEDNKTDWYDSISIVKQKDIMSWDREINIVKEKIIEMSDLYKNKKC